MERLTITKDTRGFRHMYTVRTREDYWRSYDVNKSSGHEEDA